MSQEDRRIVFAVYKDNNLVGFRQDTFGTIGTDWAKIYPYNPNQVEIIKESFQSTIDHRRPGLVDYVKSINSKVGTIFANGVRRNHNKLAEILPFEVRVLPYDIQDFKLWVLTADNLEPLEVLHYEGITPILN